MKIGKIELNGYASLAPMAGVADRAMREICMEYGAAYCVGELTSSKGITLGDKKSAALLVCGSGEHPVASQIFGRDPETMAIAAQKAAEFLPDFIDINMGCPAPKVAGNGGGSALLKDLPLAEKIVQSVVRAVTLPVTVKMRTGWDDSSTVSTELAKRCECAGARMITLHGRTRQQMYAPGIDYAAIADAVKAVQIPVCANGDITDGASAKYMYEATGCAMVAVGRAARGNPFVFSEINACLAGKTFSPSSLEERFRTLKRQVEKMLLYKEPRRAILEARKHTAWYMQGLRGAADLRRSCGTIQSLQDIDIICEKALELNRDL